MKYSMNATGLLIIILFLYLAAINLTGLLSMYIDKRRAKRGAWRIPEARLFLIAILGGSIGSIAGMYLFRHKTRHMRFVIGMPAILIVQILLIALVYLLQGNFIS